MSNYCHLAQALIDTILAHAESQIIREEQIDEYTTVKYVRWLDPHTRRYRTQILEIRKSPREDNKIIHTLALTSDGSLIAIYKDEGWEFK